MLDKCIYIDHCARNFNFRSSSRVIDDLRQKTQSKIFPKAELKILSATNCSPSKYNRLLSPIHKWKVEEKTRSPWGGKKVSTATLKFHNNTQPWYFTIFLTQLFRSYFNPILLLFWAFKLGLFVSSSYDRAQSNAQILLTRKHLLKRAIDGAWHTQVPFRHQPWI
jgi:hypothetical protein